MRKLQPRTNSSVCLVGWLVLFYSSNKLKLAPLIFFFSIFIRV